MAKGAGQLEKLSDQIDVLKYVIPIFNVIVLMVATAVFVLCMWLLFEPGLGEWIKNLELQGFYSGLYVLIVASIIMMISASLGCFSVCSENNFFILLFIGTQVVCFIGGLAGASVLLDYSTHNSRIEPRIRESMRRLIINSHHEESRQILAIIQENVGCCGADGAIDYSSLNQPLPTQCRDTVTGNPFFHGCVDELTWFFEEKTSWIAGLALALCFMHVLNVVMSLVLQMAIKKENNTTTNYKH